VVTGRAELPGRPLQYGTTEDFLTLTGVTTLEDLPASDILNPQQISAWIRDATLESPPSDEEMGLAPVEEVVVDEEVRSEEREARSEV